MNSAVGTALRRRRPAQTLCPRPATLASPWSWEVPLHTVPGIHRALRRYWQVSAGKARLRYRDRAIGALLVCTVLITSLIGVAFAFATKQRRATGREY
jgi:hypothetical protein